MGEYDAVSASQRFAALARQIADLTRKSEEDRLQLTQARQDISQLTEKVIGLAKTMADALDTGKLKNLPAPRWDGLEQEQFAAQLGQLRAWVSAVLLTHYPDYKLPECWEGHLEALWELGNLCAEWTRIYGDSRAADLEAAMWFH